VHPLTVLAVFAVIFPAELPDKTMIASLVLGSRFKAFHVWLGVAAAFAAHETIAVAAGSVLTLLPHRPAQAVVATLFAAGAIVLIAVPETQAKADGDTAAEAGTTRLERDPKGRLASVAGTSFVVVFLAEWGDLTQIATANLAAKYAQPVAVAVGAILALWSVAALAIAAGDRLLRRVPLALVRRLSAALLAILAVATFIEVARG